MPDVHEPLAFTEETRNIAYKAALEAEHLGAKARAAFEDITAEAKAAAQADVKSIEEEIARVEALLGKKSAPAPAPAAK